MGKKLWRTTGFVLLISMVSLALLSACDTTSTVNSTDTVEPILTATPISGSESTITPVPETLISISTSDYSLPEDTTAWRLRDSHIGKVAYSPEGKYLAVLNTYGIFIYQTTTLESLTAIYDPQKLMENFAWSPNGEWLVSGSQDGAVHVWNVGTGEQQNTFDSSPSEVWSMAWSPDGKEIATGSVDGTIRVIDAETGKNVTTIDTTTGLVAGVAWSPDENRFASGHVGSIRIWDTTTWKELTELRDSTISNPQAVYSIAWSPEGNRLASGVQDGVLLIWDVETSKKLVALTGHTSDVTAVAWSPDGRRLVSGSLDGTARVWNTVTGEGIGMLSGIGSVYSIALSPDGSHLAVGTYEGILILWDLSQLPN